MTAPSHICPKCRETQRQEAFINAQGKPTKWCSWCREGYRDRLTKLHQPKRVDEAALATPAWEAIAKAEGYAGHPLAHLLALAHLAGYKQRMGIQYRRAWLGKKAWRAYNDAKRELQAALVSELLATAVDAWRESIMEPTMARILAERDPK